MPQPSASINDRVLAGQAVRVLDEDPDLAAAIDPDQQPLAVRYSIAPAFELPRGPWQLYPEADPGSLGLLVLSGQIVVRIGTGARGHLELVGEGDLVSPWVDLGPDRALTTQVTLKVVAEVRVALLDRKFALRTARWPEIQAALMHRLLLRTRRLGLQAAINGLTRTEERLELTFWELALRFGRVSSQGYVLRMRLSHAQIAEMVAASRPSVSLALSRLQARGRLTRTGRDSWLLRGEPPEKFHPLAQQAGLRP